MFKSQVFGAAQGARSREIEIVLEEVQTSAILKKIELAQSEKGIVAKQQQMEPCKQVTNTYAAKLPSQAVCW